MDILYITTVGSTMGFFTSIVKKLQAAGHSVDIACNTTVAPLPAVFDELNCEVYPLACRRSPFALGNLKAIRQIRQLVTRKHYDVVHCHTPIAAFCTRIACIGARKRGTKVFYTAHGFHFYRGAPVKNWLLYYPAEWFCARFTDVLITINREDFGLAQRRMKAGQVVHVPGVGVDTCQFAAARRERTEKRAELKLSAEDVLVLSVGELNKEKDYATALRAIARIRNPHIVYAIAGAGPELAKLRHLAGMLGVEDRVWFLGVRTDVARLCGAADIFLHPSRREGLPLAVMEAMASGLPCVASRIRGNVDLLDADGAVLFSPDSVRDCADAIAALLKKDYVQMGRRNAQKAQTYDASRIDARIGEMYEMVCGAAPRSAWQPRVSIVIPAYHAANYLAQAIDSALAQTYPHVEVIVVNDGSRDDGATAAVAARYFGRIRYIEKENAGASSALNEGIRNMTGEWFSWLSHDDLYYPEKIQRQIDEINALGLSPGEAENHIFFSGADLINGSGRLLRKASRRKMNRIAAQVDSLKDNAPLVAEPARFSFHGCSCLVHRDALLRVGLFDEQLRLLNDADLWFRLYTQGFSVHFLPQALLAGRVHSAQISRQIGYSYHNAEQDMFWSRSLQWLRQHHESSPRLFFRYGINAYSKTRNRDADSAFSYLRHFRPQWTPYLWVVGLGFRLQARMRNRAKTLLLRLESRWQ